MTLLSIVLFLVLIGILSYRKYSLVVSSILLIAYTFVMGLANIWSYWLLLPVALILLPFTLPSIRKAYISAPALKAFQKVMPSMSKTEQEAIDVEQHGGKVNYSVEHQIGNNFTIILSHNLPLKNKLFWMVQLKKFVA